MAFASILENNDIEYYVMCFVSGPQEVMIFCFRKELYQKYNSQVGAPYLRGYTLPVK